MLSPNVFQGLLGGVAIRPMMRLSAPIDLRIHFGIVTTTVNKLN
jgi:hypothetical protein